MSDIWNQLKNYVTGYISDHPGIAAIVIAAETALLVAITLTVK